FSPDELRFWRGGLWRHEWHDGRLGWWWIVGDGWYFYPEPLYPYPTYVPPAIVAQPAPPLPPGFLPVLVPAMLLGGCVQQPMGPTIPVMPAPNKPFDVFQNDQVTCENFASG